MTHIPLLNSDSALRSILIVEDNEMDLDLLISAFREHAIGNPVLACRDGDEAIQYIDEHTDTGSVQFPLVMLLDLRLPKVDGVDVLRHARQQPKWKSVPIVVLTTSKDSDDVKTAYALGANAYLVKPVAFDSFSAVIKEFKMFWILTNTPPFAPLSGGQR